MKNLLLLFVGLTWGMAACKKTAILSITERIAKNWIISIAYEGGTQVYQNGSASNVRPGYSGFIVHLSASGTVIFVDFDGTRFTGKWEVVNENRLLLKDLSPEPSGTNGTVEFTIDELTDDSLTLTRTTGSNKTGNSINKYKLTL